MEEGKDKSMIKRKRILAVFGTVVMLCGATGCAARETIEQSETKFVEVEEEKTVQNHACEESESVSTEDVTLENTSEYMMSKYMFKQVEEGDEVYFGCYRWPIGEGGEAEYLGVALLSVDEGVTNFEKCDVEYPETVVTELLQNVQGKCAEDILISDGQDVYDFKIRTVNWHKEPSYQLPKDWSYQFDAPKIGSFKGYIDQEAGAIDMEDGEVYGFDEWLTDGCSAWCGCREYICEAKASSTLADQGNVNYSASNLTVENRNSVWAEGEEGNGIGESIFVKQLYTGTGDMEFTISEICIVNGYAQNETKWKENGRVKRLNLYYEDEYMGEIFLEDTMNPQYIDVTPVQMKVGNGFEANFRFEIAEVYEGTKYEDTCLTGIVIDFEGKSAH